MAKEECVAKPLSKNFIASNNLGAASSVSTTLKSLLKKELLYSDNQGVIRVSDLFFSAWLRK